MPVVLREESREGDAQTLVRWLRICLVQCSRKPFPHKPLFFPQVLGKGEKSPLLLVESLVLFLGRHWEMQLELHMSLVTDILKEKHLFICLMGSLIIQKLTSLLLFPLCPPSSLTPRKIKCHNNFRK